MQCKLSVYFIFRNGKSLRLEVASLPRCGGLSVHEQTDLSLRNFSDIFCIFVGYNRAFNSSKASYKTLLIKVNILCPNDCKLLL